MMLIAYLVCVQDPGIPLWERWRSGTRCGRFAESPVRRFLPPFQRRGLNPKDGLINSFMFKNRHSGESRNPGKSISCWIPASAGMTGNGINQSFPKETLINSVRTSTGSARTELHFEIRGAAVHPSTSLRYAQGERCINQRFPKIVRTAAAALHLSSPFGKGGRGAKRRAGSQGMAALDFWTKHESEVRKKGILKILPRPPFPKEGRTCTMTRRSTRLQCRRHSMNARVSPSCTLLIAMERVVNMLLERSGEFTVTTVVSGASG